MRLNSSGDVECASKDNKNCMWSGNCQNKLKIANENKNTSLSCGDEHKQKWGSRGYESSNHWCSKARNFFNEKKIKVTVESGVGKYDGGSSLFVEFYKDNKQNMIGKREKLFSRIGKGDKKVKEFTLEELSPKNKILVKIINITKDGIKINKLIIKYNNKEYIFNTNDNKVISENNDNRVANDDTVGWTKVEKKVQTLDGL